MPPPSGRHPAGGPGAEKAEFIDGCAPLAEMPRSAISDGVSGNPQPAASRLLVQALLALEATHPGLSPQARD